MFDRVQSLGLMSNYSGSRPDNFLHDPLTRHAKIEIKNVTSQARSTIVARYCPFWAYYSLTVFIFGNSQATSQWVTDLESALASFSLNFGVPTEPEASELPQGLVLGRDGNIHLRITPLGDVGCYKKS
ncbi:hypothetical protein DVH24_010090 [Malus domestica]|uniref:Uncharacterized protein n=1 Tax=Malus domestica TaxID=3750 RepID=A0A498JRG2_MALDO|nr:hypothetical protein DVH24_010090 [Malus domestica]